MIIKDNNTVTLEYLQPFAEEFSFSPEGMVCESDTERVDEEDGEW